MAESEISLTFPADGDRRPSTPVLKAILAQAAQPVDADLAKDITADKDWRNDYVDLFGRATLAAASSKEAAIEMARAGLEAMHDTLVLAKDAEHPNAVARHQRAAGGVPRTGQGVDLQVPRIG